MRYHYTPSELITALGGYTRAGAFFGVTPQAVYNWEIRTNRFPAAQYFEHKARLKEASIHADPGIWFPELRKERDAKGRAMVEAGET
jgi:hypothetical protein